MNNPTIFKIEYMDRDDVSIPETVSEEVGSELFSGTWVEMDVAPTTGELSDNMNVDDGNSSHTTVLNFFIAGVSPEQKMELNSLSSKPVVYRATDGEGKQFIIGTDIYRARLRFGEEISATAAGRKGYNCTVQCKSRYGPLLYSDSYSG